MGLVSNYKGIMTQALEKFQFIEETLKMCLITANQIAQVQLSPFYPFHYDAKEISKLPLGPLVKKFSKISNDEKLIQDLRSIIHDRNHVAHQSLLFTLGELEDDSYIASEIKRMEIIIDTATDIHNRILDVRYELVRAKNTPGRTNNEDVQA